MQDRLIHFNTIADHEKFTEWVSVSLSLRNHSLGLSVIAKKNIHSYLKWLFISICVRPDFLHIQQLKQHITQIGPRSRNENPAVFY